MITVRGRMMPAPEPSQSRLCTYVADVQLKLTAFKQFLFQFHKASVAGLL